MSNSVNYVWNYCNEAGYKQIKNHNKWLSEYDLNNLTADCGKELGINSQTIQSVCKEYVCRRIQFKRRKLRFRSYKYSLGWVPFKTDSISYKDNVFVYSKHKFKFFDSKYKNIDLNEIKIKTGSFNQDSKNHWFINLQIEIEDIQPVKNIINAIGIDLGLKDIITCSDSISYVNKKYYYKLQEKLGKAQRAKKKNQVKNIHSKIKNQRKDYIHKLTTEIIKVNDLIVVGDLHLKNCKSTLDAGFGFVKMFLSYKAIKQGKNIQFVNEAWTTQRCSCCNELTGPKGLNGLSVRDWECSSCKTKHQRDVNAAINILNLGLGYQTQ